MIIIINVRFTTTIEQFTCHSHFSAILSNWYDRMVQTGKPMECSDGDYFASIFGSS